MVNYPTDREEGLDLVFGALSDPVRRAIVGRLAAGEATVSELARPLAVSLPAVSRHVKVLERAGLLVREVEGRTHRCRLGTESMTSAVEWIEEHRRFWEEQLDSFESYLVSKTESGGR